jgi:GNAT superfamily N-acetyltransferase
VSQDPSFEIRFATRGDLDQILPLLEEAAVLQEQKGGATVAWLAEEYGRTQITAAIDAKVGVVACREIEIVGFMFLQSEDKDFWPDDKAGDALYVHRFAVSRRFAGQGVSGALLGWATNEARKRGIAFLRLDCVPLPKLMAVYERAGFVRVGTELFQPTGTSFLNWRYERRVDGPTPR